MWLFSTQMYVSSVEISAKPVRSIEQGSAGTGRGLREMPHRTRSKSVLHHHHDARSLVTSEMQERKVFPQLIEFSSQEQ